MAVPPSVSLKVVEVGKAGGLMVRLAHNDIGIAKYAAKNPHRTREKRFSFFIGVFLRAFIVKIGSGLQALNPALSKYRQKSVSTDIGITLARAWVENQKRGVIPMEHGCIICGRKQS